MTSIICPKCKSHISEWDVNCLNCGLTITEEIREKQIKEQQKHSTSDSSEYSSPQVKALKQDKKYKFQKKLNQFSLGYFKIGFAEMVVPVLVVMLIIIVIVFMLM